MVVAESELQIRLEEALSGWEQTAIIGIGNELGYDDSLGLVAAHRLRETFLGIPRVEVLAAGTAPENFTGLLRRLSPSHILIIDAAEMGEAAGTIQLVDVDRMVEVLPSTHTLSLKMLAKYLEEEIGSKVIIIGIQPKELSFGTVVSEQVGDSVSDLVHLLEQVMALPQERRSTREGGRINPVYERGKSG